MAHEREQAQGHTAAPAAFCPYFHRAVELVGRRWTGAIVRALGCGVTRFCELTAAIPDLSDRMLSERLKELEAEGLITRTVLPETPVRIEYHLTPKGAALGAAVAPIAAWAEQWLTPGDGAAGEERSTKYEVRSTGDAPE
ncbi:MAG TPA: helix-turn-helix domain-containing protein [Thermomicrobiales bacterium]|nr:helix-turn-helix domain-containing protein [Thermomicrobiales bacterium]